MEKWMPYISMLVSMSGTLVAILFSFKNGKRTDIQDIEARAAGDARINVKLDEIVRRQNEMYDEIRLQRQEMQALIERVAKVEASSKQAHKRLDRIECKETREDE